MEGIVARDAPVFSFCLRPQCAAALRSLLRAPSLTSASICEEHGVGPRDMKFLEDALPTGSVLGEALPPRWQDIVFFKAVPAGVRSAFRAKPEVCTKLTCDDVAVTCHKIIALNPQAWEIAVDDQTSTGLDAELPFEDQVIMLSFG